MGRVSAGLRDGLRAQLWPLPALAVVAALLAGVALPHLDARVDASVPGWLGDVVFGGDAGAARTVLDAIAGSLVTVTSLTFSLTVVTLQLASSQFSPRLLRTFARDLLVQSTLALFLATFVFALTVLRAVRSPAEGSQASFVPRFAVTAAFVLAVASVLGLVAFLAHLVRQIRVETMLRNVHAEASATAASALAGAVSDRPPPKVPNGARLLCADSSGFVVRIDRERLLEVARQERAVLLVQAWPGTSVVAGVPIAWAWPDGGDPDESLAADVCERLADQLGRAVHTDYERTAAQDVSYGLRQLSDVANKALSPGINDPTTAVHALGHLSALLCELGQHPDGPIELRDGDRLRVCLLQPSWAELVDAAIGQPRGYGAGDPQVARRMLQLLAELAWCTPPARHAAVTEHLGRVRRAVAAAGHDRADLAGLEEAAERVEAALAGRWHTS